MRNHSLLYLLLASGEPGEWQRIAESNSALPMLWKVLFADAAIGSAEVQRVLDGVASHVITTDAHAASGRAVKLLQFLRVLPTTKEVSGLDRYLAGATQHLHELIASWSVPGESPPVLCMSFDERQSGEALTHTQYMLDQIAESRRLWTALEPAIDAEDHTRVRTLLTAPASNLRFTDWKAWAGAFGLALFEHPYFFAAFRAPLNGEYQDHGYDPLGSENQLSRACFRYKHRGRWGVRAHVDGSETGVLEPLWDRVLKAGVGEPDIVWVKRDHKYALAAIAGEQAGQLLSALELDAVDAFNEGLAVARIGTRMGFLSPDGQWHLPPTWECAWPFVQGAAVVLDADRLGYIDARGEYIVQPQFDEADDFITAGVARVRVGEHSALLRSDGSFAQPFAFTQLEWSDAFEGWIGIRDGKRVLMRADGSRWIDQSWDTLEVCVPGRSMLVSREGRVGLLNWRGDVLLNCGFEALQLFSPSDTRIVARQDSTVGLLSERGELLVPFDFAAIESFEAQIEFDRTLHTPQLARVFSCPDNARPKAGVWSIEQGALVVPCQYDLIWSVLLGDGDDYGFMVATKFPSSPDSKDQRFSVGIIRADGSPLVEQRYAWIGEPTSFGKQAAVQRARGAIYFAWSQKRPVEALLAKGRTAVWLTATGEHSKR